MLGLPQGVYEESKSTGSMEWPLPGLRDQGRPAIQFWSYGAGCQEQFEMRDLKLLAEDRNLLLLALAQYANPNNWEHCGADDCVFAHVWVGPASNNGYDLALNLVRNTEFLGRNPVEVNVSETKTYPCVARRKANARRK